MTAELILTNARIVTPDEVVSGSLAARHGHIAAIDPGPSHAPGALDCDGDFIIPGLVELHTDNHERHMQPRPGVRWPARPAIAAHDGEMISVGVTTVLDSLRVGINADDWFGECADDAIEAIETLDAAGLLKADHLLHLRCELTAPALLDQFDRVAHSPRLRFVSLMDHTLGQRQFRDHARARGYLARTHGLSDEQIDAKFAVSLERQREIAPANRQGLAERISFLRLRLPALALASHDDAEPEDVAESVAFGAGVAEFPTTLQAARLSRERGLAVLMGAPNLLRGQSHSGNVSAIDLARAGLLDILSSDYAPSALAAAAFALTERADLALPAAIRTATKAPAEAVGLRDRGAIEIGRRADLLRARRVDALCAIRTVWRGGLRVM